LPSCEPTYTTPPETVGDEATAPPVAPVHKGAHSIGAIPQPDAALALKAYNLPSSDPTYTTPLEMAGDDSTPPPVSPVNPTVRWPTFDGVMVDSEDWEPEWVASNRNDDHVGVAAGGGVVGSVQATASRAMTATARSPLTDRPDLAVYTLITTPASRPPASPGHYSQRHAGWDFPSGPWGIHPGATERPVTPGGSSIGSQPVKDTTRRGFLGGALGMSAAALAGCSSNSNESVKAGPILRSTTTTTILRHPGDRPDPTKPEGFDGLPKIEHIVIVMMENHSYDNYFGMLHRGDGFTLDKAGKPTNSCPDANGKPVRAFHMANTCQLPKQPSQAWNASHAQWDNGKMDGFVRSDSGPVAMGYFDQSDIPFYYDLASTFPLSDRWFCSTLCQTYPNRRFLYAGSARGDIGDAISTFNAPPPPNGTIMEQLDRHGIVWRDYYTDLPTTALYPYLSTDFAGKVVKIDQFFTDAKAGNLPSVAFVEPNFGSQSEENPQDISRGESFAASVINAVMASPNWATTLLIWTYDEHGGYYDHVPPPPAVLPDDVAPELGTGDVPGKYDRYGIRVPAVIVSPWAKKDYVSHVVHDHTSILKLIHTKWNLPALTARDANADDLLDSLDFSGTPAFATPPTLVKPLNPNDLVSICTAPGPIPS
jgi:phospholipase C